MKTKTTLVNYKWEIELLEHIADLPHWGFWEKERLAAMYDVIRPGDTLLDIGTCNGDMSVLFAKWVGEQGKIILVEPSADFWPYIKAHFDANEVKAFGCYPILVSNETTETYNEAGWPTTVNDPIKLETGFAHLNEKPKIPVMKIDDMNLSPVNVITIDIEGSEYEALAGAESLIARDRPIIFVSIHAEFMWREHHHSPDDLLVMMQKFGYDATYLAFDHEQHWMFKPKPKWAAIL